MFDLELTRARMRQIGDCSRTLNPAPPRVKSAGSHGQQMIELIRSNDLVLLSYVRALLAAERIEYVGLDEHMNMMDGNIGAFPRRVMVDDADEGRARQLLQDAGLGHVLKR